MEKKMSLNSLAFIIAGIILVCLFLFILANSKKKRWYKVTLANQTIMLLSRDIGDRWWRSNTYWLRFKKEDGTEVSFSSGGHWVLMLEEVSESRLQDVRREVAQYNSASSKGV
jgi:hypothetical protein